MSSPYKLSTKLCVICCGLVTAIGYVWQLELLRVVGGGMNITTTTFSSKRASSRAPQNESRWTSSNFRDSRPIAQSRNHESGSWVANTWIPPKGWRYYSTQEMQEIYSDLTVLWLGDSTARRAAATMYEILNATNTDDVPVPHLGNPKMLDINKRYLQEICHKWVNHTPYRPSFCRMMPSSAERHEFTFVRLDCLSQLKIFVSAELANRTITKGVDVIIIAQGIWETVRPWDCAVNGSRAFALFQDEAIDLLSQLDNTTIVWRTAGFHSDPIQKNKTIQLSMRAMKRIEEISSSAPKFSYLDWGRTILPRSFGKTRIAGDVAAHFGIEPRLVLLQQITNRLKDDQLFDLN